MKANAERRYLSADQAPVDVSTRSDGKQVITGYSAVFYRHGDQGTQYRLWDCCVERIAEGAFDRAIREKHDVRGLFNHDPNNLLGRSSSGTCKYSVDKTGLKYEIVCDPEDPDHQRVIAKIKRGDLTGSSFAFRPVMIRWEEKEGEDSVRWIEDLMLYDVGPVTYPAYEASTTGLRSEDGRAHVEEEYRLWKESLTMEDETVRTEDEVQPEAAPVESGSVTEEAAEEASLESRYEALAAEFRALVNELRETIASIRAEVREEGGEAQVAADEAVDAHGVEPGEERSENILELKRRQLKLAEQLANASV